MTRYWSETEVVAEIEGLTVTRLRAFVSARCLAPEERGGRLAFAEADVARARLLAELADDFDLDAEAAAVVVQIHGLRARLRTLGAALAEEPEEVRARIRARIAGRRG